MLGWERYRFDKKRIRACYTELVFLHPVRSRGHVVRSGASEAQNIDALFFILGSDRHGFEKERTGTRYEKIVFLHSV
jgi:hypothetical protein